MGVNVPQTQRDLEAFYQSEGRCRCSRPLDVATSRRCGECLRGDREAKRRRLGCRPWRKGGPGRPPKGVK